MKGTVTRLRLLSLAAVVLVIAASIAVSAAPRRTTHSAAPQPVQVATAQPTAPAPVATAAPIAQPAPQAQPEAAPVATASEVIVPVNVSGNSRLWVHLDPEPGTFATESMVIPGNELNDSDEGLVEETLWDGSKMVNLQGRFQEVFVMRMGPDGKRWIECAQKHSATAPVAAPAPAPQFEER